MIAKISKSNNFFGALAYNMDKVKEETAFVLMTNKIRNGVDYSQQDALNSFAERLEKNQRTKNTLTHISLNPAPEDVIDDTTLGEIAEEYMKKMGYDDQPYIVYKHEDIDRHHLHIITTDVLGNGKRINTSQDRRRSKNITDSIEKKYGLSRADIRPHTGDFKFPKKINHKQGKIGYQIKGIVRYFSEYDFGSMNEFVTMLATCNINLEQIKGQYEDGNTYEGLVYHATDNSGQRVATPIKASSLGKPFGYKNLTKKAFKSKDSVKQKIKSGRTKAILKAEMRNATSLKNLQNRLHKQGIDIVLRKNEQDRIYGVTIIDHEEKFVANGSKFGKEFSANAFEKLSQTLEANSFFNFGNFDGFDSPFDYETISGGSNDLSHGRRNDDIDDEAERKKRKKKKKQLIYRSY